MTKLNVPGEFVEVLRKVEADVKPEHVIDALEWAVENPGGVEVTLIRKGGRYLSYALVELLEGRVSACKIGVIIYKGKAYYIGSKQAEAVLKAIEENASSEVLAATDL